MKTSGRYDAIDILIVEDNPQDAELTIRALRKQNLANQFFVVEDGEEALDFIFSKGQFEDRNGLKLPKVNGLEVLKAIKEDKNMKKLPVVVVTSSSEDPDIKSTYELGANGYVVKPVEFDAFYNSMVQTGLYWLLVNESPR